MAFPVGKYVYITAGSWPRERSWLLSQLTLLKKLAQLFEEQKVGVLPVTELLYLFSGSVFMISGCNFLKL